VVALMSSMTTPAVILSRCIRQCSSHVDGRGPWQAERACSKALGGSSIDRNAAAAARRLGEWLRGQVCTHAPGGITTSQEAEAA